MEGVRGGGKTQSRAGERKRERGTKGTGREGMGQASNQRKGERELEQTGKGEETREREDPRRGEGESQQEGGREMRRGGLGERTEREWVQEKDADGGGERESRQVGGAYVERLGGPKEAGWGVGGGTVVPTLKRRETGWEGSETEERPAGKWSAVSAALPPLAAAAATVPAAQHERCMGHYREFVPSPLPPRWGGGGGG